MTRIFITLLCAALIQAASSQPSKRPNIVLILVDDMGWSDPGCYGGEIQTPNLDTLASNGIRFRQFYNYAKCTVSRAALLTGVYASQAGFKSGVEYLRNSVTLGEVLRGAGYHTYASGKHHGLDNLYDRGFDHYYGLRNGACNHFNPGLQRAGEPAPGRKGYDREWCDDSLLFDTRDPAYQSYFPSDFYSTDAFTDKAIDYIDEWDTQGTGRPFFLYLAYTAPHDPLLAWPDDIAKYDGVYDAGFAAIRAARYQKMQDIGLIDPATYPLSAPTHQDWSSLSAPSKEDQASRMEIHAAMVDRVDQRIGDLVKKLKDTGAYDNTLIFFCSDNGAQNANLSYGDSSAEMGTLAWYTALGTNWCNVSNTPFRYDKNSAYNGGSRTPMIAHWPDGIVNPGRFADKTGHIIDYMATLVELTGAVYPRRHESSPVVPMQGESFLDVLNDEPVVPRSSQLFFHWSSDRFVIDGDFKLVSRDNEATWNLYDLGSEATEITDLSAANPALFDSLVADYAAWKARAYDNVLPTVRDDSAAGSPGDFVDVDVLANDSDGDGTIDASTLQITRQPLFGSAAINGDDTIRYTSNGAIVALDLFAYQVLDNDGEPSSEAFVTIDFAGGQTTCIREEAENATLSGANVMTNQPSASGGAHVNYNANNPPDYVEWAFSVPAAGDYDFTVGYALGADPRVLDLTVNGSLVHNDLSFPSTGGWDNFSQLLINDLALVDGSNTIRLTTNVNMDGPNLDYFSICPTGDGSAAPDDDGDGIPNWFEDLVPGLDSSEPTDAMGDLDGDGESNLLEYELNTDLLDQDSKTAFRVNPLFSEEFLLHWNAMPGNSYRIFQSTTLSAWSLATETTPETDQGKFWGYPIQDQAFFRMQKK